MINQQLKRLKAAINNMGWSPHERDCIEQLSQLKQFSDAQKRAIETLIWRLNLMEKGLHTRAVQHYEM